MTLFERRLAASRRGINGAKLWVSWPVRIDPFTLDRLFRAVSGRDRSVEVRRNKLPIELYYQGRNSSIAPQLRHGQYDDHVRSIQLDGHITLYLGPRTVYAFATSKNPRALAALWEVRETLKSARHLPGTVLYRTWGVAVIIAVAIAVAIATGAIKEPTHPFVLLTLGACVLYVLAAVICGVFMRVRFRIDSEIERSKKRHTALWAGATAIGTLAGGVIGALIR